MAATRAEIEAAIRIVGGPGRRALRPREVDELNALDVDDDPSEASLPPHRHGEKARARVRAALERMYPGEVIVSPQVWHTHKALVEGRRRG